MSDQWLVRDINGLIPKLDKVGLGFKAQNPKLLVVIFYDLLCPGCAVLEDEAGDYLVSLVNDGKASLYFVDYPVHRGIERVHASFRCIYRNNPTLFLEALRRHYEAYLSGKLKREDLERVGGECIDKELPMVSEGKSLGKELGVPGTPTIIIGNIPKNIGQAVFGYPGLGRLMQLIEELYVY
ncbi:DsbA family protein [Vulcanisaeta thermophila]|uniref:DsbA family protein n=1 Tax=Vulcanisaeta thermophila TaxID=867917 RepID=UPI0008534518|nr:thioredoxin domain-containing protein [Vulcanisaeta thermophila]